MLSLSTQFHTSLTLISVPIDLPTTSEFKASLEAEFTQFSTYYVTLFAVMALVFIVKGIVS